MRPVENAEPRPPYSQKFADCLICDMLVIRRLVDRRRSYTGLFLPGEPPRIFPTTDYEHARILQIYKQDQRYEGIFNDFTDFELGSVKPERSEAKTEVRSRG